MLPARSRRRRRRRCAFRAGRDRSRPDWCGRSARVWPASKHAAARRAARRPARARRSVSERRGRAVDRPSSRLRRRADRAGRGRPAPPAPPADRDGRRAPADFRSQFGARELVAAALAGEASEQCGHRRDDREQNQPVKQQARLEGKREHGVVRVRQREGGSAGNRRLHASLTLTIVRNIIISLSN